MHLHGTEESLYEDPDVAGVDGHNVFQDDTLGGAILVFQANLSVIIAPPFCAIFARVQLLVKYALRGFSFSLLPYLKDLVHKSY